ncbi:MAG: hypothetical protein ACP5JL_01205 [bacterium]
MIDPHLGLGIFRIAVFIILVSATLLFFLKSGTSTFVVDVLALIIGIILVGLVALLVKKSKSG